MADSKSFRWAAARESFVQHFVEALLGYGTAYAEAFLLCRKKFSFRRKQSVTILLTYIHVTTSPGFHNLHAEQSLKMELNRL